MGRDDVVTTTQSELQALYKAVEERDEARLRCYAAESERDRLKKEVEPLRLLRADLQATARSHGVASGDRKNVSDKWLLLSDLLVVLDRYNLLPEAYEYE